MLSYSEGKGKKIKDTINLKEEARIAQSIYGETDQFMIMLKEPLTLKVSRYEK